MSQDGREEVLAYVINSNMITEEGASFDTGYVMTPPAPSVDLRRLEIDEDSEWYHQKKMPFAKFRKASQRVKFHFPRKHQAEQNFADEWLCFSDGSTFTQSSIAFVADMFPQIIESFRDQSQGPFWYPTLLLNLDIKKALPLEGVKWLQVRVQMKRVRNGRMDIDVHIHDADGELVALSNHVGFVVDASRNTAARRQPDANL